MVDGFIRRSICSGVSIDAKKYKIINRLRKGGGYYTTEQFVNIFNAYKFGLEKSNLMISFFFDVKYI